MNFQWKVTVKSTEILRLVGQQLETLDQSQTASRQVLPPQQDVSPESLSSALGCASSAWCQVRAQGPWQVHILWLGSVALLSPGTAPVHSQCSPPGTWGTGQAAPTWALLTRLSVSWPAASPPGSPGPHGKSRTCLNFRDRSRAAILADLATGPVVLLSLVLGGPFFSSCSVQGN